jgi:S1-C subfamily serine protease
MKRSLFWLVFAICAFFRAAPSQAEISDRALESVVRIFCFGRDKQNGISVQDLTLPSGTHYFDYEWSTGTGFVINQKGYIITNNHVVAPSDDPVSAEHPNIVYVVQKIGPKYLMHEAKVIRQEPNSDVAVILCSTLHSDPLPLSFFPPRESDDVFSAGFPGIADIGAQDVERDLKFRQELEKALLKVVVEKFEQQNGREPNDQELEIFVERIRSMIGDRSAEFGDFLHALVGHVSQNANASPGFWDLSDMLEQKPLWKGYLEPTVTKGNIEKVTEKPGYLAGANPTIAVIQHSCNIRHGNSGGPLLNGGGYVLGVVGRGYGREEAVNWATAIGEARKLLDASQIDYVTAPSWHQGGYPVALIVATSTAVAVAIAALVLGLTPLRKRPQEGLTKLIDALKRRGIVSGASGRTIPPASVSGSWQLVGRAPTGKMFQLTLTGSMFDRNAKRLVLGRAQDLCHVVVNDQTVSRQHAHLRMTPSGFTVADRNSSNGTAVNGQFGRRPFEELPLKVGDTLTLGEVKLDFRQA